MRLLLPAALALAALLLPGLAGASAARTFVATSGLDTNTSGNCGPAAPCRTFAAALSVTTSGGEVIVVNSGGYGPFTITQSVTITAPEGVYAGIAVASGTGITINTAGVTVVLRGLTINGTGGAVGIEFDAGHSLSLQHVTISNFPTAGINYLVPTSVLEVVDSTIRDCATGINAVDAGWIDLVGTKFLGTQTGATRTMLNGVLVVNNSGSAFYTTHAVNCLVNGGVARGFVLSASSQLGDMYLTIDRTVIEGTEYAVWSDGNAGASNVTVTNSVISGNTVGLLVQLYSYVYLGNTQLTGNATAITPHETPGDGFSLSGSVFSSGNNTFAANASDGIALVALPTK